MKMLKPRSRMICVRLSQEEYDALCHLTTATGARSLSDLVRDAMRWLLRVSNQDRFSAGSLIGFQVQMDQLNRRIDELREQLVSPEQRAK